LWVGCWVMDVGIGIVSKTTTTQIILDINWCTTLLILVIQSVRASSEVTLEPWRSCMPLASALVILFIELLLRYRFG
jgi:hypothetical protein